jgi:hypothetical protein
VTPQQLVHIINDKLTGIEGINKVELPEWDKIDGVWRFHVTVTDDKMHTVEVYKAYP